MRDARSSEGGRPWWPRRSIVIAAVVYSLVAALFAPYTVPMRIATALPCAVLAVVAVMRGWQRWRLSNGVLFAPDRIGVLLVWAALIVVAVTFQLGVYFSAPRRVYPTLSSLAGIAFDWPGVRAVAFAAWLWLGWYLVER